MSKVTSKLQVTIPKVIAEQFGLRPGDEINWVPAGESLRVTRGGSPPEQTSTAARLRFFDQATQRQKARGGRPASASGGRGWTREELYDRGRSR